MNSNALWRLHRLEQREEDLRRNFSIEKFNDYVELVRKHYELLEAEKDLEKINQEA